MALVNIKNQHNRQIQVFDKNGIIRTIPRNSELEVDVAIPNVRRLLRWDRSGGATLELVEDTSTTPVTPPVPAAGGSLDFSDPANSGHIPGI